MGSLESHSPQEAIYLKLHKHAHTQKLMLIRVRFPGLWNVCVSIHEHVTLGDL